MYTRYELYLDGEPQEVGFIVGLNELDLDRETQLELIAELDRDLPYPHIPVECWKNHPLSYFTQYGTEFFAKVIQRLLNKYADDGFFDVVKIETDLSDKTIVYEDEYQVIAI
jgi:hypothetical protein